jgi:hypothetical protein
MAKRIRPGCHLLPGEIRLNGEAMLEESWSSAF